jgi:hypothetical protein
MKMVAAAKQKWPQARILAARPYALKMRGGGSNLSQRVIVGKLFPVDAAAEFATAQAESTTGGSYLYEPDEADLLNVFVPNTFPDADVAYSAGISHSGTWLPDGSDGRRDAEHRTTDQQSDFALQLDLPDCPYQRTDGHRRRCRSAEIDWKF